MKYFMIGFFGTLTTIYLTSILDKRIGGEKKC